MSNSSKVIIYNQLNCTLRQYSHLKQRPADDDKLEHLSYLSRIYNKMGTRS